MPRTDTITIPLHETPAVLSESARFVLRVHGIILPEAVLLELGRNQAQCLTSIDVRDQDDDTGAA